MKSITSFLRHWALFCLITPPIIIALFGVKSIPPMITDMFGGIEEEQCADVGFCVPKRLEPKLPLNLLAYLVCWIKNAFVWISIACSIPAQCVSYALSTFRFGRRIASIIPRVSRQDYACLLVYSYAPMLWWLFVYLFSFACPFLLLTTAEMEKRVSRPSLVCALCLACAVCFL